jgi:hypothetical protein
MSNLEKFTSVVQASLDPYFGSPLVFDESREKVSLWKNLLFIKGSLHYGHLEAFRSEKIEVLHANFYPHPLIDAPDLGFDVIWLNGTCTGYFFDFSNNKSDLLSDHLQRLNARTSHIPNRPLPEWATTFSDKAILKKPESEDQVLELFVYTVPAFSSWGSYVNTEYQRLLDSDINARQRIFDRNSYINSLKQNPKTSMALTSLIGKEDTELFMNNILYRNLE